jgi:hypothetical protein
VVELCPAEPWSAMALKPSGKTHPCCARVFRQAVNAVYSDLAKITDPDRDPPATRRAKRVACSTDSVWIDDRSLDLLAESQRTVAARRTPLGWRPEFGLRPPGVGLGCERGAPHCLAGLRSGS